MLDNFIDEVALLKAFIDHGTLSYPEVQEKGIVPLLKKQEHRALFKHTIDKFRRWNVIDIVPDSDPKAWAVVPERAREEYDKLVIEIERKQVVDKYSFEAFQEELQDNSKKLRKIKLYKALAVAAFGLAVFHFVTGLSLMGLFGLLKHFAHGIINHGH
jgi:hypothetical protein